MSGDVMDDPYGCHIYLALIGYENIGREHRTIKLTKLTNVAARKGYRLPRSGTEFFQLAKELLADRPGLECGLIPEPSYGGKRVTFDGEVAASLQVLD